MRKAGFMVDQGECVRRRGNGRNKRLWGDDAMGLSSGPYLAGGGWQISPSRDNLIKLRSFRKYLPNIVSTVLLTVRLHRRFSPRRALL